MSRWFRFYDEALNDPKVQRLDPPLFKAWVNLLCLASANGGRLPQIDDVSFALRMTDREARTVIGFLISVGLLDDDGNGLAPHNWNARQFRSDVSTERVRKHRETKKATVAETFHATNPETPPDTESDTDTDSSSLRSESAPARKRARRLPPDWSLDDEHITAAQAAGLPLDHVEREARKFRDYWHAKAGQHALKIDWLATWRNWCRSAAERLPTARGPYDRPVQDRLSANERSQGHLMAALARRAVEAGGEPVGEDADHSTPPDDWGAGLDLLPLR